jgi:hypothetical protein
MKALSIRQPFAWLIAAEKKDIENRTWPTRFRGRFLIHAAKTYGDSERDDVRRVKERFGITLPDRFELGGIVGEAELIDCVRAHPSAWFQGPYGFVIRNARTLPFRALPGKQSFFDVPDL